jgi:hypothetical protein
MRTAFTLLALLAAAASSPAQWTLQTSNTTADLRGIHNVGNGVAWASGTNGTVLRTEDGGYVWQSCSIPPGAEKLDFRGIQAFDANTAIVMSSGPGDQSRLYKTTDGCHTWKLLFTNPDKDGFWDALQFSDRNIGWLLGDPAHGQFQLWETNTSGRNWVRETQSPALKADAKFAGTFAASNSALTLGHPKTTFPVFGSGGASGAYIFNINEKSICVDCDESPKDHWKRTSAPLGSHTESSGAFSLLLIGPLIGAVVGGDYTKPDEATGTAAYTADGGKTWLSSTTPPHGYRSAVAYNPATKTWITVGPNGTDISTDDGKNWRPVHPDAALHETPDADRNWNALSLPFVVGPHGRIAKLDEAAPKP